LEATAAHESASEDASKKAILRIYNRRKALAAGTPVSATVVGSGTEFTFNEGILCCLGRDGIQISDLYGCRRDSKISVVAITRQLAPEEFTYSSIRLLNYSEGVLAILCRGEQSDANYLLAMDVHSGTHVMPAMSIDNINRLFVRHTKEVLFFGRHTGTGSHRFREWVVQGVSLGKHQFRRYCRTARTMIDSWKSEIIQFREFPGSEIGLTVAFKIHDGFFYALSNCSAFDVVEVDWTSFYHCIRFPILSPRQENCMINRQIYRRQHSEGPINDSWTELSLQADERTNKLLIVEARTEWKSGGTNQTRTFYATEIGPLRPVTDHEEEEPQQVGPVGDLFSAILDDDSKYSPWQEREPWQFHPEEGHKTVVGNSRQQSFQSFILAHTKFRSYNFTTGTFIDLVQEACDCRGQTNLCLRLRSGSRKAAPLLPCSWTTSVGKTKGKGKAVIPRVRSRCPSPIPPELLKDIPRTYCYNPIKIWPPSGKDTKAASHHHVMNLGARNWSNASSEVKAVADERSLVYLVRPSSVAAGQQTTSRIICLCFDREASVVKRKNVECDDEVQLVLSSPRREVEDNEMKEIGSPSTSPKESLSFEPKDASWPAYETIFDEWPDAEDIDLDLEMGWLHIGPADMEPITSVSEYGQS
jgi:hypothetical protein